MKKSQLIYSKKGERSLNPKILNEMLGSHPVHVGLAESPVRRMLFRAHFSEQNNLLRNEGENTKARL